MDEFLVERYLPVSKLTMPHSRPILVAHLRLRAGSQFMHGAIIHFDKFQLDRECYELRKDGRAIKLEKLPLELLILLAENQGRLVTREQIIQRLWGDKVYVDTRQGINTAIRKLRLALRDDPDQPRILQTIVGRGYRLLPEVQDADERTLSTETPLGQRQDPAATRQRARLAPRPGMKVLAAAATSGLLVLVAVAVVGLMYSRHLWVRSQPSERRLTANPREAPIAASVLSPDGKYLVYCDPTGLYVRQVASVETSRIALPSGTSACPSSWFPDSIHFLASAVTGPQPRNSVWRMSVTGGPPQVLTDEGFGAAVSGDGSQIAFLRQGPRWGRLGRELWLMQSNGERARKLVAAAGNAEGTEWGRFIGPAAWSPTGLHIAYTVYEQGPGAIKASLFIHSLESGETRVVLTNTNLDSSVLWTRDRRLLYVLNGAPDQSESSVWSVLVEPNTGRVDGRSRQLTTGRGVIAGLSATADDGQLAVLRNDTQFQVFVADIDSATKKLMEPRRVSLDSRESVASAWTADSKAVLLFSNRSGSFTIYKQTVGETLAEQLISGPEDRRLPRLTPDGSQILYVEYSRPDNPTVPAIVKRIPVSGGSPELVMARAGITNFECARSPSLLCVFGTQTGDVTTFFSFDVTNGQEHELAKVSGEPYGYNWGLSPDGSSIALIKFDERDGHIRFLSLRDGRIRDVNVAGWGRLHSVDWTADGTAILVPALTSRGTTALLQIDKNGLPIVLWEGEKDFYFNWTIPSPDGRRLVLAGRVGENNVWILQNF